MRIGGGTRGPLRVAAYPSPGSQTRSSSHWAGSRLSIPASRRIMSRSCRRAARLACLTSSCGLGPRSARNRSLALSRAVLAAFRAQVFKAFHLKMRTLLSDGNGQQLHVVGAVATISARLGHRESICTSSAMCGRAAESISAAAGSLAVVAAHLLLCPLSPCSFRLPGQVGLDADFGTRCFCSVSCRIPMRSGLCAYGRSGRDQGKK